LYCSSAVYHCCLVLPIICIALLPRLGHATGGARVSSTSTGYERVAAAACCDVGWISAQRGVWRDWSVTTKACFNAEGGLFEHILWRCLPNSPVATHHNRFFSEPQMPTHNWLGSNTFKQMQQAFSQMKKCCISQVIVVTFSGGVAKWVTVYSFSSWDYVNNQTYVRIILLKITFFGFQGKWLLLTGEQVKMCKMFMSHFLSQDLTYQKSLKRLILTELFKKYKAGRFGTQCMCKLMYGIFALLLCGRTYMWDSITFIMYVYMYVCTLRLWYEI